MPQLPMCVIGPLPGKRSGSRRHTSSSSKNASTSAKKSLDRKSTRLNSSHLVISYAVFCLKKKRNPQAVASGIQGIRRMDGYHKPGLHEDRSGGRGRAPGTAPSCDKAAETSVDTVEGLLLL